MRNNVGHRAALLAGEEAGAEAWGEARSGAGAAAADLEALRGLRGPRKPGGCSRQLQGLRRWC